MLIRTFPYSAGTAQVVSLVPGEIHGFDAEQSQDCIGTLYVYGVIAPEDPAAWQKIEKHRRYRPREKWGGWTDKKKLQGVTRFVAGPEGALSVCLSRFKEVDPQELAGSLLVPAGWGFVVGSGDVVLGDPNGKAGLAPPPAQRPSIDVTRDDERGQLQLQYYRTPTELSWIEGGAQAGEIGNYFRPDDIDREVTGNGDLLLVR